MGDCTTLGRHLQGTSLDKNTTCQHRGVGITKNGKDYKDAFKNNKTEKHMIVLGGSSVNTDIHLHLISNCLKYP